MAKVLTISKNDSPEQVEKKIREWNSGLTSVKTFPATKFTGKIKSYGDAVDYQRKMRNEWD
jgi:hypothetical protein